MVIRTAFIAASGKELLRVARLVVGRRASTYNSSLAPRKNYPLIVLIFAVVFGLPIGYAVYERYWLMFPLGASCRHNNQCRGLRAFCLPLAEPTRVGIFTRLPPEGSPGVCSTTCDRDEDCPPSMKCVKGGIYETVPGQELPMNGSPTHETKLCAP
jgi:hypothetical protein